MNNPKRDGLSFKQKTEIRISLETKPEFSHSTELCIDGWPIALIDEDETLDRIKSQIGNAILFSMRDRLEGYTP